MFLKFWDAAKWPLVAGGIFIVGMVCAMFIKYPFDKIGDLAAWVGAIGTIAAFIGTIFIATTSSRENKRQQMALAMLTLAGLQPQLHIVRIQFGMIKTALTEGYLSEKDAPWRANFFDQLQKITIWGNSDLQPLI